VKAKMKRCINCKTFLSNSSKVCTKCGSNKLEKGVYTDEDSESVTHKRHLNESLNQVMCPICCVPVSIDNGHGECCYCGEEVLVINDIIIC
jgi:hypothetical protein